MPSLEQLSEIVQEQKILKVVHLEALEASAFSSTLETFSKAQTQSCVTVS